VAPALTSQVVIDIFIYHPHLLSCCNRLSTERRTCKRLYTSSVEVSAASHRVYFSGNLFHASVTVDGRGRIQRLITMAKIQTAVTDIRTIRTIVMYSLTCLLYAELMCQVGAVRTYFNCQVRASHRRRHCILPSVCLSVHRWYLKTQKQSYR